MKTLLVLIVLGGIGFAGWMMFGRPEKRACAKISSLCGDQFKPDACDSALDSLRKSGGEEAVGKFSECAIAAKTCPEAAGCAAGAGLGVLQKAAGDFFKGVGNALSK